MGSHQFFFNSCKYTYVLCVYNQQVPGILYLLLTSTFSLVGSRLLVLGCVGFIDIHKAASN